MLVSDNKYQQWSNRVKDSEMRTFCSGVEPLCDWIFIFTDTDAQTFKAFLDKSENELESYEG